VQKGEIVVAALDKLNDDELFLLIASVLSMSGQPHNLIEYAAARLTVAMREGMATWKARQKGAN
jgi:hypothetical protein